MPVALKTGCASRARLAKNARPMPARVSACDGVHSTAADGMSGLRSSLAGGRREVGSRPRPWNHFDCPDHGRTTCPWHMLTTGAPREDEEGHARPTTTI
jgi:hypothetical protein